jgi:sporulation protein YlmC with PRC-barrel domain
MRIELGATVKTKDGHRAGTVTKVIWDPAENQVSEFVVSTGGLVGHDLLMSRDVLEQARADGKELVIDLTKHELEGLRHFDDHAYAAPPYGWLTPAESRYAATELLVPLATADERTPAGGDPRGQGRHRPAIKKGMAVKDAAGRIVGVVDELRIDDMTGELRAIVVREDGRATSSAQTSKTLEIPADHLDIGDDEVNVIEEAPGHIARRDA